MLNQLIAKYKNKIQNPNFDSYYKILDMDYKSLIIPLEDFIVLIENDIIDPTKITNNSEVNNLFNSIYFHNYNNEKNELLINFTDLLIKKGLDINKTNTFSNIPILNKYNSRFISKNLDILINKFKLNINYAIPNSLNSKYNLFPEIFNTVLYNSEKDEITKLLPVCLNLIQDLSKYNDSEISLLLSKNYLIEDEQLRLNNLKKMIELGLDLNKSYCSRLYSEIKTLDEFILLKEKGYSLNKNENDFIFPFLLNDFEKNLPIIENLFPQLTFSKKYENRSFIELLLLNNEDENLTIKNSADECYLLFLLRELVNTSSKEIIDYLSNPNTKKLVTEQKILNNLDLIKNKYHIDLNKTYFKVNHLIHDIADLKLFLMYDLNVDFLNSRPTYFNYKDVIEYKIPEMICDNPKEFNDRFFNGKATQLFFSKYNQNGINIQDPIIKNYEYLKLYIDTYGLKLTDDVLWTAIESIESKKIFNLIDENYHDQLVNLLNKNRNIIHELKIPSKLTILDFIKDNLDKNTIKTFITNTFFDSSTNSLDFLKKLCSTFGEDEITKILKNKNENLKIPSLTSNEFEYFELLNKLARIEVKTNTNYLDQIFSDDSLSLNNIIYIEEDETMGKCQNSKIYLAVKKENLTNILNKSPNKTCYCNTLLFKAVYQECMDESINELKVKYPNFDVNKCDDYGYTIQDYLITNVLLYYTYKYKLYKTNPQELTNFLFNDKIFVKNLTTLVKNGYVIKNNLLEKLENFHKKMELLSRKDENYSILMSNIEKINIINQLKIPKVNKNEERLNLNRKKYL